MKEIFYDDEDWEEEADTMDQFLKDWDINEFIDKRTGKPSQRLMNYNASDQATKIVLTN